MGPETTRPLRTGGHIGQTLVAALLAVLTGCVLGRSDPPAEPVAVSSRGLARMTDTGKLRIGTSGEQPPLSMTARNGQLLGLDVALARVLARSMGVEPVFVQLPFDRLLDALDEDRVDIVMSGLTITPERSQRVTLIGPYYTSGKCVLTKSPALARSESPKDLDLPGTRVAALAGSTSESFVRESLSRAELVSTRNLDDGIQRVLGGGVAALVADRETCQFAMLRHPDGGLLSPEATFTVEPMGIAVHPDDPRLANLIQTYLTTLEEAGILERTRTFWFEDSSWVKDIR